MEMGEGVGGGVLLALAAGLWLVYLVPSWLRRREYLATERNAVRLQQTLRVLAETAEVPYQVRAETTARSVAVQQRSLRDAQKQQAIIDAANRARDAAARRTQARVADAQPAIAAVVSARQLAARRLRRTRALTSLLLLAALVTLAVQVTIMLTLGVAVGAWAVLGFASVVALTSFSLLGRLAAVSRSRARAVATYVPARRTTSSAAPAVATAASSWTPTPLPKPLYLSRSVMQNVVIEADVAVAELQSAAAEADA